MKNLTKSENVGKAKKGNKEKFNSYAEGFDRINNSIKDGYFFEAITIEESIIVDRLLSLLNFNGYKPNKKADEILLGYLLNYKKTKLLISHDLFDKLDSFRVNRNKSLHQICKSEPGTKTDDINNFLKIAKETAISGKELARECSKLTKNKKII